MLDFYDVVASMIIGGIILLMLFGFNGSVMEGAAVQTFNSTVQSHLTAVTDIIEYDFRKMGYRVPDSCVMLAGKQDITFKGDIDNNGSVDLVSYYIAKKAKSGYPNPRAKILVREVNGNGIEMNLGITEFKLTYYDSSGVKLTGNPVSYPSKVRSIKVDINIESTAPFDTIYAGGTWERKITPMNID